MREVGKENYYVTTTTEIKMSACEQLEEVYLEGTQILGVDLPSGGRLRKVHLPSTLTTLNLINQKKIEELKIVDNEGNTDYSNLSTCVQCKPNDTELDCGRNFTA